jgi:hypothetical protein
VRTQLLGDGILNNLFKSLILVLKEVNFYFIYIMSDELIEDNNLKK